MRVMNEAKRNASHDETGDCELLRMCSESTGVERPWLFRVSDHTTQLSLSDACRAAAGAGFAGIDWPLSTPSIAGVDRTELVNAQEFRPGDAQRTDLHAVTLPMTMERLGEFAEDMRSLLDRLAGRNVRWLALAVNGEDSPLDGPDSAAAGLSSHTANRLYELLLSLRLDAEASGVNIAVDAANVGRQFGAVALRELVDAVGSSAIGICARIEFGSDQENPMALFSLLNYRVSVVRVRVADATARPVSAVGVERDPASVLQRALALVRVQSPVIVEGVPDPRAARLVIDSLLSPSTGNRGSGGP